MLISHQSILCSANNTLRRLELIVVENTRAMAWSTKILSFYSGTRPSVCGVSQLSTDLSRLSSLLAQETSAFLSSVVYVTRCTKLRSHLRGPCPDCGSTVTRTTNGRRCSDLQPASFMNLPQSSAVSQISSAIYNVQSLNFVTTHRLGNSPNTWYTATSTTGGMVRKQRKRISYGKIMFPLLRAKLPLLHTNNTAGAFVCRRYLDGTY